MKTPEELAQKYANKNCGGECQDDEPGVIKAFLAGYKAAAPQWISTKDRLPELWSDYLAFGYGPTIPASCFVAAYDPKSNKWYDMHTDWDWSDVITHWQELPEPPKEEK